MAVTRHAIFLYVPWHPSVIWFKHTVEPSNSRSRSFAAIAFTAAVEAVSELGSVFGGDVSDGDGVAGGISNTDVSDDSSCDGVVNGVAGVESCVDDGIVGGGEDKVILFTMVFSAACLFAKMVSTNRVNEKQVVRFVFELYLRLNKARATTSPPHKIGFTAGSRIPNLANRRGCIIPLYYRGIWCGSVQWRSARITQSTIRYLKIR